MSILHTRHWRSHPQWAPLPKSSVDDGATLHYKKNNPWKSSQWGVDTNSPPCNARCSLRCTKLSWMAWSFFICPAHAGQVNTQTMQQHQRPAGWQWLRDSALALCGIHCRVSVLVVDPARPMAPPPPLAVAHLLSSGQASVFTTHPKHTASRLFAHNPSSCRGGTVAHSGTNCPGMWHNHASGRSPCHSNGVHTEPCQC